MFNKTATVGNGIAEDARTAARDFAQRVKVSASDAAAAIGECRSTAAEGLANAASALHQKVDDLPGGESLRTFARSTADRLGSSAEYMRSHGAKRMLEDTRSLVKKNPGPALVVAAALGFVIGRAWSRD